MKQHTPDGDSGSGASRRQEQQGQNCSVQSRKATNKKSGGPTRGVRGTRRKSSSPQPPARIGIDTLVLTRQIPEGVVIKPQGKDWVESAARRHPITRERLTWLICDQLRKVGWRLEWNAEYRILAVRLSVPRVMSSAALANYPLRELDISRLDRVAYQMGQALGLQGGDYFDWGGGAFFDFNHGWGVKQVDCTADLPVDNPAAVASIIGGMKHPGNKHVFDTGVLWSSKKGGGRTDRYYAKGPELKQKHSKADLAQIQRLHGPLDAILRMEVSLMATDLKSVIGLTGSGWLPKPLVVADVNFIRWVLYKELHSRLKLRRMTSPRPGLADSAGGLHHTIVEEAEKRFGEELRFDQIAKIGWAYLLFQAHGGDASAIEREYGVPRSTINRRLRSLRALGLVATATVVPRSDRILRSFMAAFRAVCPTKPTKPTIPRHRREEWTISAPWLIAPDIARSVEGFEVVDDLDVELMAMFPEAAYGNT